MAYIKYQDIKFKAATLDIIQRADTLATNYAAQGYDLTLRQLFYQFVSRGWLPNKQSEYKKLGSIVNDGRLAGLIDWNHITDRTRNLQSVGHFSGVPGVIAAAAYSHRLDKWQNQRFRPEVWVEKEALAGVVARAAEAEDVAYFSCRGYVSQSEMWGAGQRLLRYHNRQQIPVVIHLGDHDPSGIDMTRDIRERLAIFTKVGVIVKRIALNMDQITRYNPPPNPAKATDARFRSYLNTYGDESWELDALDPATLNTLIRATIRRYRDDESWAVMAEREATQRAYLDMVENNWSEIEDHITNTYGEPEVTVEDEEIVVDEAELDTQESAFEPGGEAGDDEEYGE